MESGLLQKQKIKYPCDSCLVGWYHASNEGSESCQDTCDKWKQYWKDFKIDLDVDEMKDKGVER